MRSQRTGPVARALLILLLALGLGACASRSEDGAVGGATEVTLVVENNLPAAGSLTIYAVPEVGGRRMVGHVGAAQTGTLRFRATGSGSNSYRFLAEGLAGGQMASNSVSVRPGETVRWNLSSNVAYLAGD